MPKKCCVYACRTNYNSEKTKGCDKLSVFRFPTNTDEQQKWIQAVPNANLKVTKSTVICELHWPDNFEKVKMQGEKFRPRNE